ncbi:zinc ABC transporter substrate-binding protein [Zhengella mangrovi]|uniref:High-affinity zinc uptake system protein ZnuA n=1 Tax=Zhengella mangrovi TaxID=1982044 RepID=A0A2G1QPL9_9HYPH|nr:zinc ABC transporter substrate-binding protein [Zhengella mangrovi]PHP67463.1 zinc ABC transporter substrate-binding protein [Zhengella mangrovi]
MRRLAPALLACGFLLSTAASALAGIEVAASIKPVHSLVAAVMQGVGKPELLIEGAGSPHTYALKPSQARMLEGADLVFWVGPQLETFLEKPLKTIAREDASVSLFAAGGVVRLAFREGATFEMETHDGHDEPGNDDHAAGTDHGHGDEGFDPHVWLDPVNAKALVYEISQRLVQADPDNAATYEANAKKELERLDALTRDVQAMIEPVKDRPFIVFHDAYQYFENRFGLHAAGSVTISPDHVPGAERIAAIRHKISDLGATCVFSEPQFESRLIATVTEASATRVGILDPLGAGLAAGPDLYFGLIENMARSFADCLSGQS